MYNDSLLQGILQKLTKVRESGNFWKLVNKFRTKKRDYNLIKIKD